MEGKEVMARLKKGFWKPEEDLILKKYVETHGEGNWTAVSKKSGIIPHKCFCLCIFINHPIIVYSFCKTTNYFFCIFQVCKGDLRAAG